MKNCNKVKEIKKGPFKFNNGYETRWNLEWKSEHKQEDWTNLETICKKLRISEWPAKMVLSTNK